MDTRITAFLAKATEVKDVYPLARALCKAEMELIDRTYSTEASRKTRKTAYRNALRDAHLTKYFLKAFRWTPKRRNALRVQGLTTVHAKAKNPEPLGDGLALIACARQCLKSHAYSVMVPGLMLLSGRRPVELCVTGGFLDDGTLDGNYVYFKGQAKTADEEKASTPYAIPLLCDTGEFLDAHARLLTLKDFSDCAPDALDKPVKPKFKQYSAQFNEAYRKHFRHVVPPESKFYDLRSFYGILAYHLCRRPEDSVNINKFLPPIFGHGEFDVSTVLSYQRYFLAACPARTESV